MSDSQKTYIEGIGRRKEAIARVRLHHGGSGKILVNEKELKAYFPVALMQETVMNPLTKTDTANVFDITIRVNGGGMNGQADAVRLGVARALVEFNPELRTTLKKLGYLKRDARVRERKKFGFKSARRAPQFSKR
jgi:small subunit ribosomal protein S9